MTKTDFANVLSVTFEEFEHVLQQDIFYGVIACVGIEFIIQDIYIKNEENILFRQFKSQYSNFGSFKGTTQQRELIYIWCGLLNLPTYVNDKAYDWDWKDIFKTAPLNYTIKKKDLKEFLRRHSYPLPYAIFPKEKDNTNNKTEEKHSEDEFDEAYREIQTEWLSQRKLNLKELKSTGRNCIDDFERYIQIKESLESEIRDIEFELGNTKPINESPKERGIRLHQWYKEEDLKLNGKRGALKRTSEREGISRQALREILDKYPPA